MQLAIATDYIGYTNDREDIRITLRKIAEAGFSHVHWCHEWDGDYLYPPEEIDDIREALWSFDLGVKGVHATDGCIFYGEEGVFKTGEQIERQPCFYSFNEDLRRKGEALLRNRLELAAAVGATEIVLHMMIPYMRLDDEGYEEQLYTQAFRSLDGVRAYANAKGIRICLENLPGTPNDVQIAQLRRIFDHYPADFVAYCHDTGHGILTDPTDPFELARLFQDRMYMMHLNDNHSFARPGDFSDDLALMYGDEHHVMGDGVVDFETFAEITAASPYEGAPVGEFVVHGESDAAFLEKCHRRMTRFAGRVEEIRSSRRSRTF